MARYADIEKIEKLLVHGIDENGDAMVSLRDVGKAILQAENYYVVKVVMCKDCKYFSEIQHCSILGFCEPNEYCSRGEMRKEDESNGTQM